VPRAAFGDQRNDHWVMGPRVESGLDHWAEIRAVPHLCRLIPSRADVVPKQCNAAFADHCTPVPVPKPACAIASQAANGIRRSAVEATRPMSSSKLCLSHPASQRPADGS